MIISLATLFLLEALNLISTVIYVRTNKMAFELVMSYVLSSVYGVSILIYIPLFRTVMERLRVHFPVAHS